MNNINPQEIKQKNNKLFKYTEMQHEECKCF